MVYGLVHTVASSSSRSSCSSASSTFAAANPATVVAFMLLGSFSFVGIGMIAAILPLLYVERGAQMTFVLQSCLLLCQRRVLLGRDPAADWMQVLSRLSPATYVLDGVRAGLIDGTPVTELTYHVWPLIVMGARAHPVRAVGVRPRRALRQAHRQAEAGRVAG